MSGNRRRSLLLVWSTRPCDEGLPKEGSWKPKTAQSPRTSEPKVKGKGRGGQGKKGASLDEWPDVQEGQPSGDKSGEKVPSLFMGAVDKYGKYNRSEGHNRREKYDQKLLASLGTNPGAGATTVGILLTLRREERIDLTIDSGCAACALPVGVHLLLGCRSWTQLLKNTLLQTLRKSGSLG